MQKDKHIEKYIYEGVYNILEKHVDNFDSDAIHHDTYIRKDLGIKSLENLSILSELEKYFEIRFSNPEKIKTLKDLYDAIYQEIELNSAKEITRTANIFAAVAKITKEIKPNITTVGYSSDFKHEFSMDSADMSDLIVSLEEQYKIKLPEIKSLTTVQDLCNQIALVLADKIISNKKVQHKKKRNPANNKIKQIIKNQGFDNNLTLKTSLKDDLKMDNLELFEFYYFLEQEFNIEVPENVNLKTIQDVREYVFKQKKLKGIKNNIFSEIVKIIDDSTANKNFSKENIKDLMPLNSILSERDKAYEQNLICEKIFEKFGVDISDKIENQKTIRDLCYAVAGKIAAKTKPAQNTAEKPLNAKENSKQKILTKLLPDLKKYGFVTDSGKNITLKTPLYFGSVAPYMHFVLAKVIGKTFNVDVGQNVFKITDCDSLCDVVIQEKLKLFNLHKEFVLDAKKILVEESYLQDPKTKEKLGVKDINSNAILSETYNLNSLDIAETLVKIEQKYIYSMDVKNWYEIDTVEDMWRVYLKSKKEHMQKKFAPNVFESVKSIILDVCDEVANKEIREQDITPYCSLKNDLGLDELDNEQIVLAFEKKYNIRIQNTDALTKITSMQDFCKLLEAYLYCDKALIKSIEDRYNATKIQHFKMALQNKIAALKQHAKE